MDEITTEELDQLEARATFAEDCNRAAREKLASALPASGGNDG